MREFLFFFKEKKRLSQPLRSLHYSFRCKEGRAIVEQNKPDQKGYNYRIYLKYLKTHTITLCV